MHTSNINIIKTLICLIFLITGIFTNAFARAAEQGLTPKEQAPDFTLRSNHNANLRLADMRGEVVMINFWATWCGPCRQEMPLLEKLYTKYQPAGFKILAINIEKDSEKADKFIEDIGISYPVLYDSESTVSKLYDVEAMPSTMFIDREGNFRYLHKGYKPGDEESYKKVIQQLIRM